MSQVFLKPSLLLNGSAAEQPRAEYGPHTDVVSSRRPGLMLEWEMTIMNSLTCRLKVLLPNLLLNERCVCGEEEEGPQVLFHVTSAMDTIKLLDY